MVSREIVENLLEEENYKIEQYRKQINKTFQVGSFVKISKNFLDEKGRIDSLVVSMDVDEVNILNDGYSLEFVEHTNLINKPFLVLEIGDYSTIKNTLLKRDETLKEINYVGMSYIANKGEFNFLITLCIDKIINIPCYLLEHYGHKDNDK